MMATIRPGVGLGLVLTALLHQCFTFRMYQDKLPNGGRVPSPCNSSVTWGGLGHQTPGGGSLLNPFGKDFLEFGKTWNKGLCSHDSDGDGLTNGQELGDPDCEWISHASGAPAKPALSHPGICEPMTSPACQERNQGVTCQQDIEPPDVTTLCGDINENNTFFQDVRLSPTPVPPEETVYTCQIIPLNLTESDDMHMVAIQPLVDAALVVHHILLFGCDLNLEEVRTEYRYQTKSYRCNMIPDPACNSLIGMWTKGNEGQCAHQQAGFRMGRRGYKAVALQVHWNNPEKVTGLTDTSGLRVHLTYDLRPSDAGILVVGQRYLQLDPLMDTGDQAGAHTDSEQTFSATCPSYCTKVMFEEPIYITAAVNHMHYLGKEQRIHLYKRNWTQVIVTDQQNYNYDDPVIYNFAEALKVEPGDEIKTTCTFHRPRSQQQATCWGEATSDEMCFGFLVYYPRQASRLPVPWCASVRNFPSCHRHLAPILGTRPFDGCRWWEFRDLRRPETQALVDRVRRHCLGDGVIPGQEEGLYVTCSQQCRAAADTLAEHPCFKGEAGTYMVEEFSEMKMAWLVRAIMTCTCVQFDQCERRLAGMGEEGTQGKQLCSSATSSDTAGFVFHLSCLMLLIRWSFFQLFCLR